MTTRKLCLVLFVLIFMYIAILNKPSWDVDKMYWFMDIQSEHVKNYFKLDSCIPSFAFQLLHHDHQKMDDVKLVNLNPNNHECKVTLDDEEIINQCQNYTLYQNQLTAEWPKFYSSPPPVPSNIKHQELQQKYKRRVLKRGCSFPKGMWGHSFNSRCTIITMAKMGSYKPNDLILDWGSGCGHQATLLTRYFSKNIFLIFYVVFLCGNAI